MQFQVQGPAFGLRLFSALLIWLAASLALLASHGASAQTAYEVRFNAGELEKTIVGRRPTGAGSYQISVFLSEAIVCGIPSNNVVKATIQARADNSTLEAKYIDLVASLAGDDIALVDGLTAFTGSGYIQLWGPGLALGASLKRGVISRGFLATICYLQRPRRLWEAISEGRRQGQSEREAEEAFSR